jgi:uncharacterized protein YndB with AHSA1/START domain
MKFTHEVIIQRPVQRVWHFIFEPHNLKQWADGFLDYEQIKGNPREEGSLALHKYRLMGRIFEVTEQVIEIRAYELMRLKQIMRGQITDVEMILEELSENEVKLTMTYTFHMQNALYRFILFMTKSINRRKVIKIVEKLKTLLESENDH